MMNQKVKKLAEILEIVKTCRQYDFKIVTTNGCFDLLHIGHVKYLEEAKKLGDILIVGINDDNSFLMTKGRHPFVNAQDRAYVVSSLQCVH